MLGRVSAVGLLGRLLLVAFTAMASSSVALRADAQPSSGPVGSYQHLSSRAQELVNEYLGGLEMPQDAEGYNSLDASQRATFEAIVNALYAQGIFAIVDKVTAIWGEDPRAGGREQFRLSVVLAKGAVELLLSHRDYRKDPFGWGHVKKPNGDLVGWFGADSVRQHVRRPSLQISWLENDFTMGDIDIDYRENGERHLDAANSDVRASVGEELHFDRHIERYRLPPDLIPWWRQTR